MDIDRWMAFDPLRRDALIAIIKSKKRFGPTLHARPYEHNTEMEQRRYWYEFLRYADKVINENWV